MHYWRTQGGLEVDFVVYGEDVFAAIEVKNAASLGPGDFRGLKAFREDYPEAKAILSYRGKESFVRDGIPAMPVGDFLPALSAGADLPVL